MKITAVLIVEEIERSLHFWIGRLGMEKTAEVPEGGRLGFVLLQKGAAEVMLQSRASVEKDLPILEARRLIGGTALFVEVEDFEATVAALGDTEVVLPTRTTFYGMKEIVVREPGGHHVVLAAPVAPQ